MAWPGRGRGREAPAVWHLYMGHSNFCKLERRVRPCKRDAQTAGTCRWVGSGIRFGLVGEQRCHRFLGLAVRKLTNILVRLSTILWAVPGLAASTDCEQVDCMDGPAGVELVGPSEAAQQTRHPRGGEADRQPDGGRYEGEWKDGRRHGWGRSNSRMVAATKGSGKEALNRAADATKDNCKAAKRTDWGYSTASAAA